MAASAGPVPRHYATAGALQADLTVHIIGLTIALFGGGILLGLAFHRHAPAMEVAVGIYVIGFIAMLGLSVAYNFAMPRWKPLLRRFDHAGIFLMIAGSYTPFTVETLHGTWAVWMTAGVWGLAALGIGGKLFLPGLGKGFWVVLYLALGWMMLIAIRPMMRDLSWPALTLLAVGGLIYSVGVLFYVRQTLTFRRAIWHGHVVGGSLLHLLAVLLGVVLVGGSG